MTATHPDTTTAVPAHPARATTPAATGGWDRHLRRLLANRHALAQLSAAQASHGLPDARETFMAMVAVEEAIAEQYPAAHALLFPGWVLYSAEDGHKPGAYSPTCSICAAHHPTPMAA